MQETWDMGLINPWVRKIPGRGHGNPLQSSCLENPMDRRAWRGCIDHRVTKSRTPLEWLSMHTCRILATDNHSVCEWRRTTPVSLYRLTLFYLPWCILPQNLVFLFVCNSLSYTIYQLSDYSCFRSQVKYNFLREAFSRLILHVIPFIQSFFINPANKY